MRDPEHAVVTVELITLDKPNVKSDLADGWGDNAHNTKLTGQVAQIIIKRTAESYAGLSIGEDGSLILTSYSGVFMHRVDRHLYLENQRPWKG